MTWGAVAGAAIGVIGGAMNASSASGAAATQAQAGVTASNNALLATQQTNQLNANMYQQGMINQAPYLSTGQERRFAVIHRRTHADVLRMALAGGLVFIQLIDQNLRIGGVLI